MKCLLCGELFTTDEDLIDHYISFHKVDPTNKFFQKLFQDKRNSSILQNCLRCGEFLTTSNYKRKHNFLKHYKEGKKDIFEDKPTDIVQTSRITKYEITVRKHGDFYDFTKAEEVVNDFLQNVRSKFKATVPVLIKARFTIENIQPAVSEDYRPIINSRYWSTDVYKATYFNDYVFYHLRQDITKRVIANGLSGSSWVFKRFLNLTLSVLKLDSEIVQ